jgi:dihydroorotate dehydrogenase (NAD+) catalytic subunit
MADLSVCIGRLKLKNPVMVSSGTFGYADEFRDFFDPKDLGAVVTKTITVNPRKGNPMPRTCETPAGMLNSIGLENPGIDKFLFEKMPYLKKIGTTVIISIASDKDPGEFLVLAERLERIREVAAIELNLSCPNLKKTRLVSQDPLETYSVVKKIRKATKKTLITKLSPNVADISEIAQAAESAGSDAVSLVNTLTGMSVDIYTRKSKIARSIGGLSGPAIRPVAVRMVWEVFQKVKIPIIGMGGIMDAQSALEFFIAGASAVSIGTANFINPRAAMEVISGIKDYLRKNKMSSIRQLTGSLQ